MHPLSDGGTNSDAIQKEKKLLKNIRKNADYIIDTTNLKPMELQNKLLSMLSDGEDGKETFKITVQSFGYKHGMSMDADLVFDARFIPNPYYLKSMRDLTGNNQKVREYVMKFEETQEFIRRTTDLVEYLIPYYMKQGKMNLLIAFGCTGGQHRSVAMANEFSDIMRERGKHVTTVHRDVMKR